MELKKVARSDLAPKPNPQFFIAHAYDEYNFKRRGLLPLGVGGMIMLYLCYGQFSFL